jgi:hypothetical protein
MKENFNACAYTYIFFYRLKDLIHVLKALASIISERILHVLYTMKERYIPFIQC